MTIIQKDGSEMEISDNSAIAQAYNALEIAAQRIARNNAPLYLKRRGSYTITAEHEAIVKAMPALLAGSITPEEAMGMLHGYDTLKQRLG